MKSYRGVAGIRALEAAIWHNILGETDRDINVCIIIDERSEHD
jgi:hypothetical protein